MPFVHSFIHLFIHSSLRLKADQQLNQLLKQFSYTFVSLATLLEITAPKESSKKEMFLLLSLCSAEANTLIKDMEKGELVLRKLTMQQIAIAFTGFATKEVTFRGRAREQAGGRYFFTSHSKVCLSSSIKGDRPCLINSTQLL